MISILISIVEFAMSIVAVITWIRILGYIRGSIFEPPDIESTVRAASLTNLLIWFLLLGWSAFGMFHVLNDPFISQFWLLIVYILGYLYSQQIVSIYDRRIKISVTPKE